MVSAPRSGHFGPAARRSTTTATTPPAWFVLLAFGVTVVLFAAAVSEIALRLGQLSISAASDPRCAGSDSAQLSQKGLFELDAAAGYVMRPNLCVRLRTSEYDQVLRTNSRGIVGSELPATKPSGEFRIVVLGDSYTVGGQVPYEQTFPALLEQDLRQRGASNVRVIDMGVGGYTTYNEAGLLREDLSWLQPDLVVVAAFLGNDVAENILATDAGYALDPQHPKGLTFGPDASALVQQSIAWFPRNGQPGTTPASAQVSPITTVKNAGHWVWDGLRTDSLLLGRVFGAPPDASISTAPGQRPPSKDQRLLNVSSFEWTLLRDVPHTYWLDAAWPLFGTYLADIRASAASVGAPAVVLVIPEIAQVDPSERARTMADYRFREDEVDWDQPQRELRAQAEQAGLPVVDLLTPFRQQPDPNALYLALDEHFTGVGHATTADLLVEAIIAHGWLH